jgi:hypothetical protein
VRKLKAGDIVPGDDDYATALMYMVNDIPVGYVGSGSVGSDNYKTQPTGVPGGVIAIDANHHVSVISAEPDFATKLDIAASMLNSSEDFLLNDTPPPKASPRAQYRRIVSRDAADARQALLEILHDRYGFDLTPAR